MEMDRLGGSMGQDRTTTEEAKPIYWCQCHSKAGTERECPESIEIGWVMANGEYIAKGIPNG
jgi:hypothetical protein